MSGLGVRMLELTRFSVFGLQQAEFLLINRRGRRELREREEEFIDTPRP